MRIFDLHNPSANDVSSRLECLEVRALLGQLRL